MRIFTDIGAVFRFVGFAPKIGGGPMEKNGKNRD
jgi:hypothetical protein